MKEKLKIIDTQGMHTIYDKWPKLANSNFKQKIEKIPFDIPHHIVFAGMGGSGAINDVFSSILSKSDIHVDVVKGYHLPKTVKKKSLLVCTSVSGNTVETISVLKEGIKIGCKIIVFSSNGKISNMSNKIEYRKITLKHSPRASFIGYLFSMLNILSPILPIKDKDVLESLSNLKKMGKQINSKNLTKTNPSLNLAYKINKSPIIYYPWGLQASAIRFKNSLQENAKIQAFQEDVIEASHNGIVPWSNISQFMPILIEGNDDFIRTKERWKVIKTYFQEKNIKYVKIKSEKGNILTKLVNLIYMLDYASIYLAILNNTDPTPVKAIDFIKNRI